MHKSKHFPGARIQKYHCGKCGAIYSRGTTSTYMKKRHADSQHRGKTTWKLYWHD